MIVNCNISTCAMNVAGECVGAGIEIVNGKCQSMEQTDSTGEIIDEDVGCDEED